MLSRPELKQISRPKLITTFGTHKKLLKDHLPLCQAIKKPTNKYEKAQKILILRIKFITWLPDKSMKSWKITSLNQKKIMTNNNAAACGAMLMIFSILFIFLSIFFSFLLYLFIYSYLQMGFEYTPLYNLWRWWFEMNNRRWKSVLNIMKTSFERNWSRFLGASWIAAVLRLDLFWFMSFSPESHPISDENFKFLRIHRAHSHKNSFLQINYLSN